MFGEISNVKISGVMSAVPENVFDNYSYIETIEDKKTKKQVKLSGIHYRHTLCKGQKLYLLASSTAENLLHKLGWSKDDVRVLINVTQTPELTAPSTAMLIQKEIGLGVSCLAFDVNLGCSGYISGVQIVCSLLRNTGGKGILITGDGEYKEYGTDIPKDALLFGCGVSATAIELSDNGNRFEYCQFTDGSRYDWLYIPKGKQTITDGNSMLLFSMNEVRDSIRRSLEKFDYSEREIDWFVFHQSQKMAVEGLINECCLPADRVLISYDKFGNTSSSSIPVTICNNEALIKQKNETEITLFMCGYGIGLAWNTAIMKISTDAVFPIESISM